MKYPASDFLLLRQSSQAGCGRGNCPQSGTLYTSDAFGPTVHYPTKAARVERPMQHPYQRRLGVGILRDGTYELAVPQAR